MRLTASCPRCAVPVPAPGECSVHGSQPTLWRPEQASYVSLTEHLRLADGFPTYLPWPLGSGWRVSDFGVVVEGDRRPVATITCSTGSTEADGRVDVLVVAEEPGVGLGGRCAGLERTDPGDDFGLGPATARLRVGSQAVSLWPVSTVAATGDLDRSVVAGELAGRWLWMVMMPASSALLLADAWMLRDVSGDGPHLVDLPIEGPAPLW